MVRMNVLATLFGFLLVLLIGCGVDQENQPEKQGKNSEAEKAAEFLRGKGAQVWFVPKTAKLPGEAYWSAHLGDDAKVVDADLTHLKRITGLKSLGIGGRLITDQGIAALGDLNQLEVLFVSSPMVTDRGIDKLADIKTLKKLTLNAEYGMKITGQGFERFGGLEKLEYLNVQGLTVSDDALAGLKELKRLEHLDLSETKITDKGLKSLKGLERLEVLWLRKTGITDAGMEELVELPSLKYLNLQDTAVGNEGVKVLSRSKTLATLMLVRTRIDDHGLEHIANFQNLTTLDLAGTTVSDDGVKLLQKTRLTWLKLVFSKNDKITDKSLEYVKEMKTLKDLFIQPFGTKVTTEGLQHLRKARPDLDVFTGGK